MDSYYVLKTLGCKANFYDSQLIEAELQKRGWKPLPAGALASPASQDSSVLCVVNSCTVTDEADRQSRKMAAKLARDNPNARVVVTGCAAEVDPERLTASKGIHYVIGNRDKPKLVEIILDKIAQTASQDPPSKGEVLGAAQGYEEILSKHPMDREWPAGGEAFHVPPTHLDGHSGKTRAFLKIQEGCNSFCTYCIIPYGRGPARSLRPREVIEQVRKLISEGIREIVITGTNIGDYGSDWAETAQHGELFQMILQETSLERLRVSSLDPTEITDQILDLMAREPRFCPHFHVSLQSPHSRVLRLMKRRYGFEQVESCLKKIAALRAPVGGVFVGMDVITGFPGESESEFEWGYEALSALPWTRLHVFPYSEREGTPATRLPGSVRQDERVKRARKLNELSLARMRTHHEKVLETLSATGGSLDGILLERAGRGPEGMSSELLAKFEGVERWQAGYTSNYLRVFVPEVENSRNELVSVVPVGLVTDPQNGDVAFVGRVK
ncbi:MAG: tRNA (N(6)-L-threonylcarbamoyladenosine(37)-C(2))-methylthiotransferase MtaB [Bdellovibrionia bacterium]